MEGAGDHLEACTHLNCWGASPPKMVQVERADSSSLGAGGWGGQKSKMAGQELALKERVFFM